MNNQRKCPNWWPPQKNNTFGFLSFVCSFIHFRMFQKEYQFECVCNLTIQLLSRIHFAVGFGTYSVRTLVNFENLLFLLMLFCTDTITHFYCFKKNKARSWFVCCVVYWPHKPYAQRSPQERRIKKK